jgi:benzoyl-CoA reductase/2-hydroxyglutaryl-CoA dehydratase subunit BcrC/BadD/HgdB
MKAIAYCSPFIPAEWIAAHGLQPHWLRLRSSMDQPLHSVTRGICPYAGTMIDTDMSDISVSAIVLTTICDQMRYAAAMIDNRSGCPVFLMNVPSTWQTDGVKQLYLDELRRLGRFLMDIGGNSPDIGKLAEIMLDYDRARLALREARGKTTARQFADVLAAVRGPLAGMSNLNYGHAQADGIPLAILGGPLLESDYDIYNIVEQSGGRIVLDGTDGGERTLPRPFDLEGIANDPMQEMAGAYFDWIPDMFRRPNTKLYEWLGRELAAREVHGIIFRRYVWCDLWHAELQRLIEWSPVPVLGIDAGPDDISAPNRVQGRIEAFLEMLR